MYQSLYRLGWSERGGRAGKKVDTSWFCIFNVLNLNLQKVDTLNAEGEITGHPRRYCLHYTKEKTSGSKLQIPVKGITSLLPLATDLCASLFGPLPLGKEKHDLGWKIGVSIIILKLYFSRNWKVEGILFIWVLGSMVIFNICYWSIYKAWKSGTNTDPYRSQSYVLM